MIDCYLFNKFRRWTPWPTVRQIDDGFKTRHVGTDLRGNSSIPFDVGYVTMPASSSSVGQCGRFTNRNLSIQFQNRNKPVVNGEELSHRQFDP
jgi:hypothetical protein